MPILIGFIDMIRNQSQQRKELYLSKISKRFEPHLQLYSFFRLSFLFFFFLDFDFWLFDSRFLCVALIVLELTL